MFMGLILTLIFLVLLLKSYRKGVIIIAATIQMLSYLGIGIISLKIQVLVEFVAIGLYFFYYKTNGNKKQNKYPRELTIVSLFFILSFVVSEVFSRTTHHWFIIISNIGTYFIYPFILWKCLDSRRNILICLTTLYWFMIFAMLFGLLELVLRSNYVLEFISNIFTIDDFIADDKRIRFGLKRCNSFFSYFTTYGVACCFSFVVFFRMKYSYLIKKKYLAMLILMMPFCAFSTGSRAIFLGLFVILLFMFTQKAFWTSKTFQIFLLIFFILSPVILDISFQVIDSIVNSDTSKYSGGSSASLRIMQWECCLPSFLSSPIIGNGRLFIWEEIKPNNPILLGAESIWFSILVDFGIFGALAFLNLIFCCCVLLYRIDKRLVCVPVAYLLILSLSPDIGVQYNILITYVVLLIRMDMFLPKSRSLCI